MKASPEQPVLSFASRRDWERWLAKNHEISNGIWLRFFRKESGTATVIYADALEVALCHGWIDGQFKKFDETSWLQRFTPRRPRSIWSKRNTEKAEALIRAGKMKPAGLRQVDLAKQDGRWHEAYDSPSKMQVPDDFLEKLSGSKKALEFYQSLNKSNTYAIAWRLQTAKKPETREKRMNTILEMLGRGEKFHF